MNELKEQIISLILKAEFFTEEEKKVFISRLPDNEKQLKELKVKLEEKIAQFERDKPIIIKKVQKIMSDYKAALEEYKNKKIREILKKAEEREKEDDLDGLLENI